MMAEESSGLSQRELLLEVRSDVKAMRKELTLKADRQAVDQIEIRVSALGDRISSAERSIDAVNGRVDTAEAVARGKGTLISVVIALVVMIATVITVLLRVAGA